MERRTQWRYHWISLSFFLASLQHMNILLRYISLQFVKPWVPRAVLNAEKRSQMELYSRTVLDATPYPTARESVKSKIQQIFCIPFIYYLNSHSSQIDLIGNDTKKQTVIHRNYQKELKAQHYLMRLKKLQVVKYEIQSFLVQLMHHVHVGAVAC